MMIHLVLVNNESISNSPPKYANWLIVTHHVYKTKMSLDEQDRNFFDYRYLAWVDLINFYGITGSFFVLPKGAYVFPRRKEQVYVQVRGHKSVYSLRHMRHV